MKHDGSRCYLYQTYASFIHQVLGGTFALSTVLKPITMKTYQGIHKENISLVCTQNSQFLYRSIRIKTVV